MDRILGKRGLGILKSTKAKQQKENILGKQNKNNICDYFKVAEHKKII